MTTISVSAMRSAQNLRTELAKKWMNQKTMPVEYTFKLGSDSCTGRGTTMTVGIAFIMAAALAAYTVTSGKY